MSFSGNNNSASVGTVTTQSNVRQLSDGNPIGNTFGKSTSDLISFYAVQPVPQPGTAGLPSRAVANLAIYTSAQSPSAVAANTSGERAFTVTGVLATDMVAIVNKPTTQAGLMVGTARVSAANTVQLTMGNDTSGSITPTASENYQIVTIGSALQNTAVLSPTAVAANTTSEQTFAVPSAVLGAMAFVNKPTAQAGLIITNCRVTATGFVAIQFQNLTASPITPTAAETYTFAFVSALAPAPTLMKITQTLTPAQVAANTSAEQTFTVPGLLAGTTVFVDKPSLTANLTVAGARVSAANTLAINFANNSGATITPPVEAYIISWVATAAPSAGNSVVVPVQKGDAELALFQLGLISAT